MTFHVHARWLLAFPVLIAIMMLVTGCEHTGSTFPAKADVEALVVQRPKIPAEALTDPTADAQYRSDVRAWEDDLAAAGLRVCRFLNRQGMDVNCE